jgi:hypothetical protein
MSLSINLKNDLQLAYNGATQKNGLINLTKELRSNNGLSNVKIQTISTLFKSLPLWKQHKKSSGHVKFKHKITDINVEFPAHNSRKESTFTPFVSKQILEQVQKHLNIMGNDIFTYKKYNWKQCPNLKAVASKMNNT